MRTVDLLSDIETIAAIGSGRRAVLLRGLQQLLFRYASKVAWPHYRDRGVVQLVNDHTTGNVNVTNGSTTVSAGASAPSFPASITTSAGRKFRVGSSETWYDILTRDSASQLTLRAPYQGDTATDQSYLIYQDVYRLQANCERLLDLIQMEDQVMLIVFPYLEFDHLFADVGNLSDPLYATMVGRRDDRYTTGTVALSANGRDLTGSGTPSWDTVEGLGDGSRLAVEDTEEVFTVRSVDSATAITAYEAAAAAETSSAYRAYMNNLRVQVRDIPDAARNLYYRFQRRPYLPVRNFDELDAPTEHHGMLKEGMMSLAWRLKGKEFLTMSQDADRKFNAWLEEQVQAVGRDWPMPMAIKDSTDRLTTSGPPRLRLPNTYGLPLNI